MRSLSFIVTSLALGASASPLLTERQSSDVSIPTHFQCKTDSDCAILDVGNCCGTYIQCANPAAKLPHPCPHGGASICGWPVVHSCKCGSLGGCVSLQSGRPVHGGQWDPVAEESIEPEPEPEESEEPEEPEPEEPEEPEPEDPED